MMRRLAMAGVGLALVTGCASSDPAPGDGDGSSASSDTPTGGNGTLLTTDWGTEGVIRAFPINSDGSVGESSPVLSGTSEDGSFPAVIDGVGPAVLSGIHEDYWTVDLQVHESGEVVAEVPAPGWCGGEGLTANICVLLDADRVARTSKLGRDPVSGEGATEGSIIVSSLADGSTLAELGPFPDLTMILGTDSADQLLLVTTPWVSAEDPSQPSTVLRLDLVDQTTTEVGTSAAGWLPLCPIAPDSVLGYTLQDNESASGIETVSIASVVGPAAVADIEWSTEDPAGCSVDGRFLYLPSPPTDGGGDTEAPDAATVVKRVTLSSGDTDEVLVLDPEVQVTLITR